MKTIEERVAAIVDDEPGPAVLCARIRAALLEIAKDQRHACAEAVRIATGCENNPFLVDKDSAIDAVLNAEIKVL